MENITIPSALSSDKIPVLWVDDALLVIDKPSGLLSLPDGFDASLPYLQSCLEPEFGKLWIVHRLDRETSGVLVLARSAEAHHLLNDQFSGRLVKKIYHAITIGAPSWEETQAESPLRKNGDRQHRTVIDFRYGKPASTGLRVLEVFPSAALIEASPHTGYTHQIRAHLTSLGLPLLGDRLYTLPAAGHALTSPADGIIDRVALHALEIHFIHPITHQEMDFSAPYPPDFENALIKLRAAKNLID
jgi:RluA family pseudouridine synthase